jgi:glycosyltransferase involved in cell wall biosynthesis
LLKLSVVSHYYNNASSVEKALQSYRDMASAHPGAFEFILVDDHSHEPMDPKIFEGLENLRVFRITADVAWNMPAARNIGVHEAASDKVLLLDIDHVVEPGGVEGLLADAERLSLGKIGHFQRMKRDRKLGGWRQIEPHINSFMIHKSDFLRAGGFEERFSGNYGAEDKYFQVCCRRSGITDVVFDTKLLVSGSATENLDRDKSVNTVILEDLLERRVYKAEKFMTYSYSRIFPERRRITFEESAKTMLQTANDVRVDFTTRFNAAVAAGDPTAYTPEFGIAGSPDEVGELGYHPRAPIKFVYKAKPALELVRMYLPFFEGIKSAYEIGVRVGYLLRALIDVHGIDARGSDVDLEKLGVYREMRARLGLADLVEEQWIIAGNPIAIPHGTEAVTTFMSVFDGKWSKDEYRWFFAEMKRNGVTKVLWRPNRIDEESREFFASIGGTFPVAADENRFMIVSV